MNKIKNSILFILATTLLPPQYLAAQNLKTKPDFDWQGHRGCRGILPENSIPAFLKALDLGVTTLEMDLAVSADSQLIVSHEPWLNSDICVKSDGSAIKKEEAEQLLLIRMTAEEIKKCDCGSLGNPRFKEQLPMKTYKPTLEEVVDTVKKYCMEKNRALPFFNIEIKSQPDYDEKKTPSVSAFSKRVVTTITSLGIKEKTYIQSFDPRALACVKVLDPTMKLVFLVENQLGLKKNLKLLTFKPDVYSPFFKLLDKKTISRCHKKGIKVIPWTVNETADMQAVINLGVDGIITDYPNRVFVGKD
jgi:glycerophosphoryl diester phosphodiesterase